MTNCNRPAGIICHTKRRAARGIEQALVKRIVAAKSLAPDCSRLFDALRMIGIVTRSPGAASMMGS